VIEIRLHGRGGQGAVTASRIIATAAYEEGKFSQAIPMYGTERRGAPLTAYVRIDENRVRERELVHNPDISICFDPLISLQQAVANDVKSGGKVLLNAPFGPEKSELAGNIEIATVDATGISLETLGRPITNTAMCGAFAKATGIVTLESVEKAIKKYFPGRLGDMNIAAVRKSYEKVSPWVEAKNKIAPKMTVDLNVGGYGMLKDVSSWRVFYPSIDEEKCIGCKTCWIFCPEAALEWKANNKPAMIDKACKGCGVCANECPVKCIEMKRVPGT
jgi:2-oxoacid:acceptor oxidoreductase gamma subunit (pyruvate/2-ketoisovalerate family)/2-oxoacid:acceptor oxidoreductase delta subunit (pyruvate/2-ketoisovalerate family)